MNRSCAASLLFSLALLAGAPLSALAGDYSSSLSGGTSPRDERMDAKTQWDYQPGQGPRAVRDQDYFRPDPVPSASSPSQNASLAQPTVAQPVLHDQYLPEDPVQTASSTNPKTADGVDVGFQVSQYHYHEATPPSPIKIQGPNYGLTVGATATFAQNWFTKFDFRGAATGQTKYKGSTFFGAPIEGDVPNYLGEIRAMIGRDLIFGRFGVSPFIGVGYRILYSDLEKLDTGGYGRLSQYLFAPIGLEPKLQLPNGARLSLLTEFDPLLHGWQDSYLSNVTNKLPDIHNDQKHGYGLRGAFMYEANLWAVGPFFNYWNINQSNTTCDLGKGVDPWYICGDEPHNHTVEYGMNFRYRFH